MYRWCRSGSSRQLSLLSLKEFFFVDVFFFFLSERMRESWETTRNQRERQRERSVPEPFSGHALRNEYTVKATTWTLVPSVRPLGWLALCKR